MKRKVKYSNGGKVRGYSDGGPVKKPVPRVPSTPPKADPAMLGSGQAAAAADILRNRRRKQIEDAGG